MKNLMYAVIGMVYIGMLIITSIGASGCTTTPKKVITNDNWIWHPDMSGMSGR